MPKMRRKKCKEGKKFFFREKEKKSSYERKCENPPYSKQNHIFGKLKNEMKFIVSSDRNEIM